MNDAVINLIAAITALFVVALFYAASNDSPGRAAIEIIARK